MLEPEREKARAKERTAQARRRPAWVQAGAVAAFAAGMAVIVVTATREVSRPIAEPAPARVEQSAGQERRAEVSERVFHVMNTIEQGTLEISVDGMPLGRLWVDRAGTRLQLPLKRAGTTRIQVTLVDQGWPGFCEGAVCARRVEPRIASRMPLRMLKDRRTMLWEARPDGGPAPHMPWLGFVSAW